MLTMCLESNIRWMKGENIFLAKMDGYKIASDRLKSIVDTMTMNFEMGKLFISYGNPFCWWS